MTARPRPAARPRCSRRTCPRTPIARRRRPLPGALPRPRDRADAGARRAPTRRSPPYAATRGRIVVVTGKYPANAQLHVDHLGLDVDHLEGWVWGAGKADGAAPRGRDDLRRRPRPRRRGRAAPPASLSVSVLTGGCTREELRGGRHRRRPRRPRRRSRPGSTSTCSTPGSRRSRRDLRERGSVLVAYSGGADSAVPAGGRGPRARRRRGWRPRPAYSDSLPAGRARPGPRRSPSRSASRCSRRGPTRWSARATAPTPATAASSARPSCSTCSRPLAAEHGLAARRDRHQRRRRRSPASGPGIRAAAERGAITPLRDAGLTKAQVREASRRWGLPTWDKPAAACLSSRVAYGIEVTPHRLARVERAEAAVRAALAAAGVPVRDLRVRDLGERASVEVDAALLAGRSPTARCRAAARRRPRGRLRRRPPSTPAGSGPAR